MRDFDKYLQKSHEIQRQSDAQGDTAGYAFPWAMIVLGVIVTGFQTHALSYRGMQGSALYNEWLDIAALLPVLLLEGTAVSLIYCRQHVFKGDKQRSLAHRASYAIWAVLLINTVAVFTLSGGSVPGPVKFWTRYVLPLAIVAVPYLWKRILDLNPGAMERVAILDAEAQYNAQWRRILSEQRQQVVNAYEKAATSEEVRQATEKLVTKAALKQAAAITGAIAETETELRDGLHSIDSPSATPGISSMKQKSHLNGATDWDGEAPGKH